MLFKRDYLDLTEEERDKLNIAEAYKHSKSDGIPISISFADLAKYHELKPYAAYHYESLFPNNYVLFNGDTHQNINELLSDFIKLINNKSTNERDILNFIRDNEAYFILEALFEYYDFGHHDAYLFREFPLPPEYICDFLLVGKNSSGFEFVFIEFEHPNDKSVLKDGELGPSFRKGIKQLDDWEHWLESNFHHLKNVFNRKKGKSSELPNEFYELDKSRLHFLVVAGRRVEFKSNTYRKKRTSRKNKRIIHYDNLIDVSEFYVQRRSKK